MEEIMDHNALIEPPKMKYNDIPVRKTKYIIDSRDRNTNVYKNPANYTIKLDEGLTDVTSIELILSDFKFNCYQIRKTNNLLHTDTTIYVLKEGKYDGFTLASMIQSLTPFIVTFDPVTDKLTFVSTTNVTLKFKNTIKRNYDFELEIDKYSDNSVGKVIGFDINDYKLIENVPFTAPYPVDLVTENYIVMFLQQAKVYLSVNNKTQNAFAIINKSETDSKGLIAYDNIVKKSFNPPIANLSNLKFKFCDYSGNLYDFQNKEHRFELIFYSLKQTRCYNEIFK
jgi:hypothetical protein